MESEDVEMGKCEKFYDVIIYNLIIIFTSFNFPQLHILLRQINSSRPARGASELYAVSK